MDYQQPHGYTRPPPPASADPYQRPPSSLHSPQLNHPWPYSATQFQYQLQTQHSPSPPPPQWPPPHCYERAPYPPHPPPPPYPAHQPPYPGHSHYPPPHPLPPRPPHVPQSYSQDWGSGSWSHHQSWQYPSNNNEEDWGAKAKAWLAAKAATENQHPSSQFLPAGRPEEQNHFVDQYSQLNDSQFLDVHTQLAPASNYQQHSGAVGPPNRTGQLQDSKYISSGQSSYAADMHVPFAARDGSLAGDSITPVITLVHQQEVPCSYSSVAGNEEAGDRYEKFNSSSSLPVSPHCHVQPLPPASDRSGWMEEHHNFGSMPAVSAPGLSDQPLNFAPHFNRNLDPHAQPNYTHTSGGPVRGGEPIVALSSNYAWTPSVVQAAVYPPVPPSIPPGAQVDHPIAMPSPASGLSAPIFSAGPSFQPAVPLMGAAFGVGAGVTPPPKAFPGDAYGVFERPKKASVPNWLREEIIKNKSVITSSAPEILKDDSPSIEEDSFGKSSRKGYQVDSKSIDSSRSTQGDDEDEDEVEAARTAAINQEIKRVLTEVLLKVTDDLFDEIATKVLKEEDLSVQVGHIVELSNQQISPPMQSVLTSKASAKLLIPIKIKESDYEDAGEKSTSGAPGDVLGLASYASDEEDEETQSSGKLNSKQTFSHQQSSSSKLLEGNSVIENGVSPEATEEQKNFPAKLDIDGTGRKSPVCATPDSSVANVELNANREARDLVSSDDRRSSKRLSRITEDESNVSKLNNSLGEKDVDRNQDRNSNIRRLTSDDSRIQDSANRYHKNDRLENRSPAKKDHKDSESSKESLDKGDKEHVKRARTGRTNYNDSSKYKGKEKGKTDDEVKNTESRKRLSPSGGKEGTTETQRNKRSSGKNNNDRRQDRAGDEKSERSRHKSESESRHKRRRSSSVGVRGRDIKDNSVVIRANDSNDESSDDSRRKSHHSKREPPSPIRSRKRQVSRSPHSKHSKRRHSPYSSLEATRGKRLTSRSRSRSPIHRRR